MTKKVFHIFPDNDVGGVQACARSLIGQTSSAYQLDIIFIQTESQVSVLNFLQRCFHLGLRIARDKPDLVVCSLWKGALVGITAKILWPGCKIVNFYHSSKNVHFFDFLVNRCCEAISVEVWVDSAASCAARVNSFYYNKAHIINPILRSNKKVIRQAPTLSFVYWGRLHPDKGLRESLIFISFLVENGFEPNFLIIGPESEYKTQLDILIFELGLQDLVLFSGELSLEEIGVLTCGVSFFIQLSKYEGMAMSVVEAMNLGLICLVTDVGEIKNFGVDGSNLLLFKSCDQAKDEILSLLSDPLTYENISIAARETFANVPSFVDSYNANLTRLLTRLS